MLHVRIGRQWFDRGGITAVPDREQHIDIQVAQPIDHASKHRRVGVGVGPEGHVHQWPLGPPLDPRRQVLSLNRFVGNRAQRTNGVSRSTLQSS